MTVQLMDSKTSSSMCTVVMLNMFTVFVFTHFFVSEKSENRRNFTKKCRIGRTLTP